MKQSPRKRGGQPVDDPRGIIRAIRLTKSEDDWLLLASRAANLVPSRFIRQTVFGEAAR